MAAFQIATVGDNCIDRYLAPVRRSTVGGNAVNVAVQLRRLGCAVGYFGAVGRDADGERIRTALAENAVDISHLKVLDGRTAYTDIGPGPDGDRIMLFEEFGVCRGYRPERSEVELLCGMRHVHIGWLDDGGDLKRSLAAAGVSVSQDISVNAEPASVEPSGLTIAFASAEASRQRGEKLLGELLAAGAELAVVTCGALGSLAGDGLRRAEMASVATEVVDTTGAGDSFIAGFIAAHLQGADLEACLRAGSTAAAATCIHLGGFPQQPIPLR